MGDMGGEWEAVVERVIQCFAAAASDDDVLVALDRATAAFVSTDLIHRLVPFADRLRGLSYEDHPGAGLSAGVAICAVDRVVGRRTLSAARVRFAQDGDPVGEGYGCFLEGLEDLGEGNLSGATEWWQRSRQLLGPEHAVESFTMAHLALGAYQEGDLARALVLAEESLGAAEHGRNHRLEAISALYVGFFRLWTGDFARVQRAVEQGLAASERIVEPLNRYDAPLIWAVAGALASLRGEPQEAETAFATGLQDAAALHNEWHGAILRSVRAQFAAREDPVRAIADAKSALDYFERVGERWWSSWARHSLAATHLDLGDLAAAAYHCRRVLEADQSDLERGRALLVQGQVDARSGNEADAKANLDEAIAALDAAGAAFWVAQAELVLASVDNRRASYLQRSAQARAGRNRDDPGWIRMLRGPGSLEVRVLGGLEACIDGHRVSFKTRAEAEALAMLVEAAPGGRSAALIADRLWPEANGEQATHRLDNLLSSLRQSLLPTMRLRREHGMVRLELAPEECDLLQVRQNATGNSSQRAAAADRLRQLFLGDSPPEWAYPVQDDLERLRHRLLAAED